MRKAVLIQDIEWSSVGILGGSLLAVLLLLILNYFNMVKLYQITPYLSFLPHRLSQAPVQKHSFPFHATLIQMSNQNKTLETNEAAVFVNPATKLTIANTTNSSIVKQITPPLTIPAFHVIQIYCIADVSRQDTLRNATASAGLLLDFENNRQIVAAQTNSQWNLTYKRGEITTPLTHIPSSSHSILAIQIDFSGQSGVFFTVGSKAKTSFALPPDLYSLHNKTVLTINMFAENHITYTIQQLQINIL